MQTIWLILYIVLPALVWMAWLGKNTFFKRLPIFAAGMALALTLHGLWQLLGQTSSDAFSQNIIDHVVLSPFLEELGKALILIFLWQRKKLNSLADGILWGLALGFGFAAGENLIAAFEHASKADTLAVWYQVWFRSLRTPFLHAGTAGLMGLCLGLPIHNRNLQKRFLWPIGFFFASTAHAAWNLLGLVANTRQNDTALYTWITNGEIAFLFGGLILIFGLQSKLRARALAGLSFAILVSALFFLSFQRYFLVAQARQTQALQTATAYLEQSPHVKTVIELHAADLQIKDVTLTRKNNLDLTQLQFKILHHDDIKSAQVWLLNVSDFTFVYDARLIANHNETIVLDTPYQDILDYEFNWNAGHADACKKILQKLEVQITDEHFKSFLSLRQAHIDGHYEEALEDLQTLSSQLKGTKNFLIYEKALLFYDKGQYHDAAQTLQSALTNFDIKTFSDTPLPQDAFAKNFSNTWLAVKSRILLAKAFYDLQDYDSGVFWAKEAALLANGPSLQTLMDNALYLKALNLQAKGDFKLASLVFDEVLANPQNVNLPQKAWCYFFKSETAIRENRHDEVLDNLEKALSLDPQNATIRQKAILYLIERNYPGDLEVALAFSLRGTALQTDQDTFVNLASQLYQRLGLADKTLKTQ